MHSFVRCLKNFQNNIVGVSWSWKQYNTKNKCRVEKMFFSKNVIRESRATKDALTNYDTASICRCWISGWYFYKTHLATLDLKQLQWMQIAVTLQTFKEKSLTKVCILNSAPIGKFTIFMWKKSKDFTCAKLKLGIFLGVVLSDLILM